MDMILLYGGIAIAAYLIGSLNGSLLSSRLFWRDDIRKYGSGNAGATNVLRTYGVKWTVLVSLWDIGKGVLAVWIGRWILPESAHAALLAGLAVIIGHVLPLFFKFKGGKGVFTSLAVFIAWDWQVASIALGVFLLVVLLTRFVSLGSICAGVTLPFLGLLFDRGWDFVLTYAAVMLLLIVLHRENIKRLLKGTENKFGYKKKTP